PDGDAQADADALVDVLADAPGDTATEADADADEDTAPADVGVDVDAPTDVEAGAEIDDVEASEAASLPDLTPKVCRSDVENVVFTACATTTACHGRFPDGKGGMYIGTIGDWTQNVVNVRSKERKDLKRVLPGDPKNSWFAHKLVGDQCLFGSLCTDG